MLSSLKDLGYLLPQLIILVSRLELYNCWIGHSEKLAKALLLIMSPDFVLNIAGIVNVAITSLLPAKLSTLRAGKV